jgi:Holliday junction DNA helicase RuvA
LVRPLIALGYSDKEAQLALKTLPPDVSVSEGIKQALKGLAR